MEAYLLYAELLENMKEYKLSEQYYKKCIAIFRGSWDPHRQNDLYYAIHNLGWLYQEDF